MQRSTHDIDVDADPSSETTRFSYTQRLEKLGKLNRVPHIFCDSIMLEPMDNPIMIDIAFDHVIDSSTLDLYRYGDNGLYKNPHHHIDSEKKFALLPANFNATEQAKVKQILINALEAHDLSLGEKTQLIHAIADIHISQENGQEGLLQNALANILKDQPHSRNEVGIMREEINQIHENLARYHNEVAINELYESHISSLERIAELKQQVADLKKSTDLEESDLTAEEIAHIKKEESNLLKSSLMNELIEFISATEKIVTRSDLEEGVLDEEKRLLNQLIEESFPKPSPKKIYPGTHLFTTHLLRGNHGPSGIMLGLAAQGLFSWMNRDRADQGEESENVIRPTLTRGQNDGEGN